MSILACDSYPHTRAYIRWLEMKGQNWNLWTDRGRGGRETERDASETLIGITKKRLTQEGE